MDKSFQKELLERRNTILLKKEMRNTDAKNTIKHKRQIQEHDYLVIDSDNNEDITHKNLNNIEIFNKIRETSENKPRRYSKIDNKKQITIDLTDADNTITKKNLFCFSALIVACYISITILNDYILIKYFN